MCMFSQEVIYSSGNVGRLNRQRFDTVLHNVPPPLTDVAQRMEKYASNLRELTSGIFSLFILGSFLSWATGQGLLSVSKHVFFVFFLRSHSVGIYLISRSDVLSG
jgi:hypothetical protein